MLFICASREGATSGLSLLIQKRYVSEGIFRIIFILVSAAWSLLHSRSAACAYDVIAVLRIKFIF